jgi:hypothetical protein
MNTGHVQTLVMGSGFAGKNRRVDLGNRMRLQRRHKVGQTQQLNSGTA